MSKPKPVRRLVTMDDERGTSRTVEDGPAPDVRTDPARPGFSSTLIWATDRSPARIANRLPAIGDTMAPPPSGSLCRIVALPPDRGRSFIMQKTCTLDFCIVLEGAVTLILDTEEVQLSAGDVVVQRGTRHSWSNRSDRICILAISSHDATEAAHA